MELITKQYSALASLNEDINNNPLFKILRDAVAIKRRIDKLKKLRKNELKSQSLRQELLLSPIKIPDDTQEAIKHEKIKLLKTLSAITKLDADQNFNAMNVISDLLSISKDLRDRIAALLESTTYTTEYEKLDEEFSQISEKRDILIDATLLYRKIINVKE